jgi:hypothetical protein
MTERDEEVEGVLVEIRQRLNASATTKRAGAKGAGEYDARRDLLARVEAGAAVASRAWDRLPPIMSDRRGWRARLELGLKRLARRATNWFTWEQINFNAATAEALRAAHALLREQAERETDLRARLDALEAELEELRDSRANR